MILLFDRLEMSGWINVAYNKKCSLCHSLKYILHRVAKLCWQAWPHPVSAGIDRQAFAVCVKRSGLVQTRGTLKLNAEQGKKGRGQSERD